MWSVAFAVAQAAELVVTCEPGGTSELLLVGLPPFEIRCTASYPDGRLAEDAVWRFGDGDGDAGAAVSHVYEEVGRYPLSAEVWGVLEDSGQPTDWSRRGEVAVCGAPRPRFSLRFRGGLHYLAENTTPPDPGCVSELRWEIFRGRGQGGQPVFTSATWSPRFELPAEGEYTVVLTVGGIGGVEAAATTIVADGGLTDQFREVGATACATGPATGGGWGFALGAGLLAVRRRRR